MSPEQNRLKSALQHELDALQPIVQELQLKAALARADFKSELDRLEVKLRRAHEEVRRLGEHVKEPLHELEVALRALITELRASFEQLRKDFETPSQS
jgi:predicted nuclease with TOPRIM domain